MPTTGIIVSVNPNSPNPDYVATAICYEDKHIEAVLTGDSEMFGDVPPPSSTARAYGTPLKAA